MSEAGTGMTTGTERIALQRAVAVITPASVAVKPSRAGLVGPVIELVLTAFAVWVLATFIQVLPLWADGGLLLFLIIVGPTAVLGFVYQIAGSSFLIEREKRTARWQQGFLGLGLGTRELVPFERMQRVEVVGDFEDELGDGDLQDVVRWEVRLIKDNDRVLEIGAVSAARSLADEALDRANDVAAAIGAMAGVAVRLGELPEWALADYADDEPGDEAGDLDGGETIDPDSGR